jgi:hypothetical protein
MRVAPEPARSPDRQLQRNVRAEWLPGIAHTQGNLKAGEFAGQASEGTGSVTNRWLAV